MKKLFFAAAVAAVALTQLAAVAAAADWAPSGPIKLIIAFRAGGGADTQGRLLAEELEARHGWKIIPENLTGKGGANMARSLKDAPADGLTIGVAVTETFTYVPVANPRIGYTAGDFTFITTTAPTQMGIVVRADKGWKTMDDLVKAAKGGANVSFSTMSPRLADGAAYIADHFGIDLNLVSVKGGKGSLNAIVASDVDAGWVAGIQSKGVAGGDLLNLASGETSRLAMSPDALTMAEMGVPFDFGAKFVVTGPAGLPAEARSALAASITEILSDPNSKAHQFVTKAFGPPLLVSEGDLDALVSKEIEANEKMLDALDR